MSNSKPTDWRVEMPIDGRSGVISYHEGSQVATFDWEFGGGKTVAIIYIGKASEWSQRYPWAASRRQKILERVKQEVIKQRAPTCQADFDEQADGFTYLLIHEPAA